MVKDWGGIEWWLLEVLIFWARKMTENSSIHRSRLKFRGRLNHRAYDDTGRGTPWRRLQMLLHFVCTLEGPAVKSHDECILFFSFSESLSYHIIIPAGDGPSLLKVLQSITYFFFLPHLLFLEMGVNSMTFSYCLSLSNINNVLRGLHTQNGISFKGILSFAMYVFSLTFEGIDQLTEWQVAAYRQMAGGEIDPFFLDKSMYRKKNMFTCFFFLR